MTDVAQEALRAGLAEAIHDNGCGCGEWPCRVCEPATDAAWVEGLWERHADAVLAYLTSHRAEVLAALGMEHTGWSGHWMGDRFGRVHDKNSVHMDGCVPVFAPKETPT